jgi:hypothetical protein
MHNPFELSPEEKAAVTGAEQLAMFERLVEFVNERLSEIETLKTEVEKLKNPNP